MNAHTQPSAMPATEARIDIIDTAHVLQYDVRILYRLLDRVYEDAKYTAEKAGRHYTADAICEAVGLLTHQANIISARLNGLVTTAESQLVRP